VGVAFAETGDEDAEGVLEVAMHALTAAGGQMVRFAGHHTGASRPDPRGELRIAGVVQALVETLETRDPLISDHLRAVSDLSRRIGARLSLSPDQLDTLTLGALLHDVGKIGVPDRILQKPTRLTEEEYEVMRRHPTLGARMLAPIRELAPALAVVKYHHERFDGEGYPDGLRGENIPLAARIVSAADAFDAMMRDRPYGYGVSLESALEEITRGSGSRFDPEVVGALLETQTEERRSSSAG
jgi:HD-GYP domain-containing protein (c-di-GMP phosphodiesterase class II)